MKLQEQRSGVSREARHPSRSTKELNRHRLNFSSRDYHPATGIVFYRFSKGDKTSTLHHPVNKSNHCLTMGPGFPSVIYYHHWPKWESLVCKLSGSRCRKKPAQQRAFCQFIRWIRIKSIFCAVYRRRQLSTRTRSAHKEPIGPGLEPGFRQNRLAVLRKKFR